MSSPFKLIIEDDEGRRNVVPIELGTVQIGRAENNAIRLNERNISRNHVRLVREEGAVLVQDLGSYNGVFINGTRISDSQPIHEGDLIRVGDFHLELRGEGLARRTEDTTQRSIVPLDDTQPQIIPPEEETQVTAKVLPPEAGGAVPVPVGPPPRPPPSLASTAITLEITPDETEVEKRAEPTAIISVDRLQDQEPERKKSSGVLTGERPKLLCVSTQFAGTEFEIKTAEAVIGRTDDNDICLDHRSVSRHHAKIISTGNNHKIVDLNSANGTLVNGEQYAQLALKSGDLIELGHVRLRFIPPGTSYTPNDEERAAIMTKGRKRITETQPEARSPHTGVFVFASRNPLGALVAVFALVGVLAVLGFVLSRNSAPPVEGNVEPVAETQEVSTEAPVESLLEKAQALAKKREWAKAHSLASLVLERDPSQDEAHRLLGQIQQELAAKEELDNANKGIEVGDWEVAWESLNEIPSTSTYAKDADKLKEQVRPALAAVELELANEALNTGRVNEAASHILNIEGVNPEHESLPDLKNRLEQLRSGNPAALAKVAAYKAKMSRHVAPTPEEDEEEYDDPSKPGSKKSKLKVKPTKKVVVKPEVTKKPTEPTPAAQPTDAKSYYMLGVAALQGNQTAKAIDSLNKCVQIDKAFCVCYRALGIAYARSGNGSRAARYYRLYLKYCPTAKDAKQVEQLLSGYGVN